jgi:hypothetical protein
MQIRLRVLSESSTCRENKYKPSTRLHVEAFLIATFRYAKATTSFLLETLEPLHRRRSLVYALPCGSCLVHVPFYFPSLSSRNCL